MKNVVIVDGVEMEATTEGLHTNIVIKVMDNKYRKKISTGGIILPEGSSYKSQETGQMENDLEQIIAYAEVVHAGPACLYLKPGDGVYVDTRSLRPLPFFGMQYMQTNEMNVLTKVVLTPVVKKE